MNPALRTLCTYISRIEKQVQGITPLEIVRSKVRSKVMIVR